MTFPDGTKQGQSLIYNITVPVSDGRRTGNLMFDFATLIATAYRNKMRAVWMPSKQHTDVTEIFNINVSLADTVTEALGTDRVFEITERGATIYNPAVANIHVQDQVQRNVLLRGYFQCWKYFVGYEDKIRQRFTFKESILTKAIDFYLLHVSKESTKINRNGAIKINIANATLIGVHVRRGDLTTPKRSRFGYTVADKEYFRRAVRLFTALEENPHFIVCSDDITWCKNNLFDLHPNMTFSEVGDAAVDLAILASCQHTIMSTGTFGWWAAWLADGITVYYENWPRHGSVLFHRTHHNDFFLPRWIPMI